MTERHNWQLGDVARLKKPHVCGGLDWRVTRVGMDMDICCLTGGREVRIPRWDFERRVTAQNPGNTLK